MNNLGQQIDDFEVPVCNIFVAKNWKDKLCYELNLNLLKVEDDINDQLKDGILLVLDFNEERQFYKDFDKEQVEKVRNYIYKNKDNSVQVHIDSIGNNNKPIQGMAPPTSLFNFKKLILSTEIANGLFFALSGFLMTVSNNWRHISCLEGAHL